MQTDNGAYPYDFLISALGCRMAPEEVPGMAEAMGTRVHAFYTLDGAFAACSGPGSSDTAATLSDGPHTFQVRAIDPAANPDHSRQQPDHRSDQQTRDNRRILDPIVVL